MKQVRVCVCACVYTNVFRHGHQAQSSSAVSGISEGSRIGKLLRSDFVFPEHQVDYGKHLKARRWWQTRRHKKELVAVERVQKPLVACVVSTTANQIHPATATLIFLLTVTRTVVFPPNFLPTVRHTDGGSTQNVSAHAKVFLSRHGKRFRF